MIIKMHFIILISIFKITGVLAQHTHPVEKAVDTLPPLSFEPVRSEQLTDPELKTFKMESSVMTVAPGAQDTVSHRHDCELFGYVLEGNVEIALGSEAPKVYSGGQMFYEKRNILHSLTKNVSKDHIAKVLLIFIIKDGRKGYTRVYPDGVK